MATPVLSTPESVKHPLIASPWHTLFLIVAQGLLSFRSKMQASHAHVLGDRIGLYERTIFFEWLMFALMILGVWRYGSSVLTVLGERWRSVGQVFRDIGIAVLFLVVSITIESIEKLTP